MKRVRGIGMPEGRRQWEERKVGRIRKKRIRKGKREGGEGRHSVHCIVIHYERSIAFNSHKSILRFDQPMKDMIYIQYCTACVRGEKTDTDTTTQHNNTT